MAVEKHIGGKKVSTNALKMTHSFCDIALIVAVTVSFSSGIV